MTERTLDFLVASIKAERRYVGKRPYSHNIISCLHHCRRSFFTKLSTISIIYILSVN